MGDGIAASLVLVGLRNWRNSTPAYAYPPIVPTGPEAINATHCSSCGYMQLNAGHDARSGAISQWLEQCPALREGAGERSGEDG